MKRYNTTASPCVFGNANETMKAKLYEGEFYIA